MKIIMLRARSALLAPHGCNLFRHGAFGSGTCNPFISAKKSRLCFCKMACSLQFRVNFFDSNYLALSNPTGAGFTMKGAKGRGTTVRTGSTAVFPKPASDDSKGKKLQNQRPGR
jgi:hypothetical protein